MPPLGPPQYCDFSRVFPSLDPPWKRLQKMGFSPSNVERAIDAFDSFKFEDLFNFLINSKKDEPQQHEYAKHE